jgi:hypothetical protein
MAALLVGLAACAPSPAESPAEPCSAGDEPLTPADLFRADRVHTIALQVGPAGLRALAEQPSEEVAARLHWGEACWRVGVRLKGNATFRPVSEKASFKVRADWAVPGQRVFGLTVFNLHNLVYDASAAKEYLAYSAFRAQDLPAPRTGWAWVTLSGEEKGLYSVVEDENEDWLAEGWPDPSGSLYEAEGVCDLDDGCGCYQRDVHGADDKDDLAALCAASQGAWASVEGRLDDRRLVGELATEIVLGSWDSYAANGANYKLYHEPATGRWSLTPWSMDKAFASEKLGQPPCGTRGNSPSEFGVGRLAESCMADDACLAELREAAGEAALALREVASLQSPARALLAPFAAADPTWAAGAFDVDQDCLAGWIEARPEALADWIDG